MADDRADPIRGNYDAEAEEHIFGIINGDIPYVPAEEDEEEDVSSYLNLDGEGEGHQQGDDEGTDTVDGRSTVDKQRWRSIVDKHRWRYAISNHLRRGIYIH